MIIFVFFDFFCILAVSMAILFLSRLRVLKRNGVKMKTHYKSQQQKTTTYHWAKMENTVGLILKKWLPLPSDMSLSKIPPIVHGCPEIKFRVIRSMPVLKPSLILVIWWYKIGNIKYYMYYFCRDYAYLSGTA
jgi:hypothetical protein